MNLRILLSIIISIVLSDIHAQKWISKDYAVGELIDVSYGTSNNFSDLPITLKMDIRYPLNDIPDPCGRPLMIVIHGGSFIGGDNKSGNTHAIAQDFAARGYVTANITYRLGMFYPSSFTPCNLDGWNCLNALDSSEWIRAVYRGIQDVHGATRYLIANKDLYQINPKNVFFVGESAGAILALQAGYLDEQEFDLADIHKLNDASTPDPIFFSSCANSWNQEANYLSFERNDLGPLKGVLNPNQDPYIIRGVGAFYGGFLNNLFNKSNSHQPALYLFHQPNDLLVPFNSGNVLQGLSNCANELGGCAALRPRPYIHGSKSIEQFRNDRINQGYTPPPIFTDFTNNNANCLLQVLNPASNGHSIDNYAQRTLNMATFFADHIDEDNDCFISTANNKTSKNILVYPNPVNDILYLQLPSENFEIEIYDLLGVRHMKELNKGHFNVGHLQTGIYILKIKNEGIVSVSSFQKM